MTLARTLRVALLATIPLLALSARASAATPLRAVQGTLPARAAGVRTAGAADPSAPMHIGVLVAHPHPQAEDALLKGLFDPSSAGYHQFLTPRAYAQRFGVRSDTRASVLGWLRDAGLHVDTVSAAGDYVLASGTTAQVASLAHVRMARFTRGSQSFVGNLDAPRVPARLPILSLIGLDGLERHTALAHQAGAPNVGDQSPEDLRSIYEQPSSETGAGVPVAILGNGATTSVIKDLHTFDTKHKLRQLPVDVVHTPANGKYTDTSGNVEWNIDMQAIHGMAPGLDREVLYFSPTLADSELTASLATWVNDKQGPPIMNASLGECEEVPVVNPILNNSALKPINGNNGGTLPVTQAVSQASEPATTMLLQQAVIEGRNFFASSGDNGSSCSIVYPGANGVANEGAPLTSDPASTPFTNAVGGTVLYSDGETPAHRTLERAWEYSGGNSSPFIPAPAFQQGIPNLNRPCVLDKNGQPTNTGKLCRGVPDVAALSGDVISNGYTIISDGDDASGGGTSLSSPLWAGMWARIAGSAPKGSSGFGFADEAFYKIAKNATRYSRSFFDVTVGSNGANPAMKGYDYVTGLGAPKVSGLLSDVPAVAPARKKTAASAGGGCRDTIAPNTKITSKRGRLSRKGIKLAGRVTDRGCGRGGAGQLGRVGISVYRHSGKRCVYVIRPGHLGRKRTCKRRAYIHATGLKPAAATTWKLRLRGRVRPGRYVVVVRGRDAAGNLEPVRKRNVLHLRVR